MTPLLAAVMIACSLTIDAAHNWYDIVGGSIIGTVMAVASYRSTYAAVLDWRYNHLPLREKEPFGYGSEEGPHIVTQTFTRSVGWGGERDWFEGEEGAGGDFDGHPGVSRGDTAETAVETRPKRRVVQREA